ncbi:DUF4962 domain-containing protein [Spirosoma aureum]|uniref:DUF4962 domain-containing protein n=1 Tax=Spirosoma aureum TaxID=2692134 RepID=A0A6G9AP44_9BACT|nr:heparinase II/III family protein [Spirosoma aureum]QIP14262.1 DUF4962 domain-containing protein [Spirosoma aureum]
MKSVLVSILAWIALSLSVQAQKPSHPYLFFSKERLETLTNRIKTDTAIARNWNDIRQEADNLLTNGDRGDGQARTKIEWLALAYLMTTEKKYADKVKDVLIRLCSQSTWSNQEMMNRNPPWTSDLQTADRCWSVAIGYDAIYNTLSKDERKIIVDGVVRNGIKPALNDWVFPDTRIHTLNSMGHNWWSACVDMAGIASLAILDDQPEAADWVETVSKASEEWMRFSGDQLQAKPRTFDRTGGMYESVNYASFGSSEYLFFRLAYANTFPGKKQPDLGALKKLDDFFAHVSYPRTGPLYSLNFGDGDLTVSADRPVKLLYALGSDNPNDLWYMNQLTNGQHREGLFPNMPIGLVYQPDMSKAPKLPNLATSALFADMNWASMRNSWERDATMLGVKSGYTWNHSHADANSFILFHKGEDIIKDAGNSSYGSKDYPGYFFQSQAHNVILFNGKAQPTEQQYNGSPLNGKLSELMDAGDMKYIMANGTGPTSANFSRNFRHYLWLDKVILIIDDVKAYETGKFQWLLHPGGESKKVGGDINIVKGKSSVLVRPLFPETLVQTGFDHDFPEKMKLTEVTAPKARDPQHPTEIYYSIDYPEPVKQTKFITAIILKDTPDDKDLPIIERLHSETMQGVRIKQHGKITEVYLNLLADGRIMHLNSVNQFNGWDTDAYLFGITYPDHTDRQRGRGSSPTVAGPDEVNDYFMAYGSYVRKNQETVFSSLSKVFMMARKDGNKLNLILQGQPLINASFRFQKMPDSFFLNHQPVKPVYDKGQLRVRVENGN